jgi:hypothetical protein
MNKIRTKMPKMPKMPKIAKKHKKTPQNAKKTPKKHPKTPKIAKKNPLKTTQNRQKTTQKHPKSPKKTHSYEYYLRIVPTIFEAISGERRTTFQFTYAFVEFFYGFFECF